MVRLFSCKAHDGDYFWLRYKHDAEELYHNLVIDGGRKSNASDFCEMLKRIYENGEKIDAMVLTHFLVPLLLIALGATAQGKKTVFSTMQDCRKLKRKIVFQR